MQYTYQLNTESLNLSFLEAVKAMFGRKEVKIIIEDVKSEDEKEKLFYSLFGSWQGEELVKQIYSARVSK